MGAPTGAATGAATGYIGRAHVGHLEETAGAKLWRQFCSFLQRHPRGHDVLTDDFHRRVFLLGDAFARSRGLVWAPRLFHSWLYGEGLAKRDVDPRAAVRWFHLPGEAFQATRTWQAVAKRSKVNSAAELPSILRPESRVREEVLAAAKNISKRLRVGESHDLFDWDSSRVDGSAIPARLTSTASTSTLKSILIENADDVVDDLEDVGIEEALAFLRNKRIPDIAASLGRFSLVTYVNGRVIRAETATMIRIDRVGTRIEDSYDFEDVRKSILSPSSWISQPLGWWFPERGFVLPDVGGATALLLTGAGISQAGARLVRTGATQLLQNVHFRNFREICRPLFNEFLDQTRPSESPLICGDFPVRSGLFVTSLPQEQQITIEL